MRNIRGYQYCCAFAAERQDVSFLFDAVSRQVFGRLWGVKAFGRLSRVFQPDVKQEQMVCNNSAPSTLEVSIFQGLPLRFEERKDLW